MGRFAVVLRETTVGVVLGGCLGLLAFPLIFLLFGFQLAVTVSITMLGVCAMATLVGSFMPLLAVRFGIDPAVISAPVVTTVVDASGLILYFFIAKVALGI
jgi:magnesium transporter